MARRSRPGGFYDDFPTRIRFEHKARQLYPGLSWTRTGRGPSAEVLYTVKVAVPEYEARRLTLRFADLPKPRLISVEADGPTDSPHRYGETELCIWHPKAPREERWEASQGLAALIYLAQLHLWREAFFRETGEWAGLEADHAQGKGE